MTDPKTDAAPEADKPTAAEAGFSSVGSAEGATPLRAPAPLSDPPPAAPARAPRARGGGGWATFAALVALAGAGASIAGPSLRPYLAEQLTARFGEHELIGILTGTAAPKPKDPVQIELAAFDQRMAALAQALGQPGGPAADPETLKALTVALGKPLPDTGPSPEARRLAELEGRFAALGARLGDTAAAAAAAAKAQSDLKAELAARLDAAEQAGTTLAQRIDGLDQGLAAARKEGADALAAQTVAFDERLAAADRRIGEVDQRSAALASRNSAAVLLALVSRVRLALEMSEPFDAEAKTLATLVNGDPETRAAVEALASVAGDGVSNLPRLQQTLKPLLAAIVESERAATATWYAKASSLLFWSQPWSSRAETLGQKTDAISRDLRSGLLDSAVWKLRGLDAPMTPGLQTWLAEANRRLLADQALRALTAIAFKRAQG
ncbi:MAG TPA: hypothetical protein VD860_04315 [Azospirillum sp.]|nr:hypothetical protein [Azospirillum sp.]